MTLFSLERELIWMHCSLPSNCGAEYSIECVTLDIVSRIIFILYTYTASIQIFLILTQHTPAYYRKPTQSFNIYKLTKMPYYSSRRPSRHPSPRRDHAPMPDMYEHAVPTGSFAAFDYHEARREYDSRVDDRDGDSRRDYYARADHHTSRRRTCCSADDPHPLSDLDRGYGLGHYFIKLPSARAPPRATEYDEYRARHAYEGFSSSKTGTRHEDSSRFYSDNGSPRIRTRERTYRDADSDKHRPGHGYGNFSPYTSSSKSSKYRESRYHSDSPTDFYSDCSSNEDEAYYSDNDEDSRHPESQRSGQYPGDASSSRGPSRNHKNSTCNKSSSTKDAPRSSTGYPRGRDPSYDDYSSRSEYSRYDRGSRKDDHGSERSKANQDRAEGTSRSSATSSSRRRDESYSEYSRHESKPKSSRGHQSDDRYSEDQRYKSSAPPPKSGAPLPDHYRTLGISSRASAEEIKKAARSMRVQTHPDKAKRSGMSASELKRIDEKAAWVGQAADVLQDPDQKRAYDKQRAAKR